MKVMKHPWLEGIFVGVAQAEILQTLSSEATPLSYTKADGTEKEYHWLSVGVKDNNGNVQAGSAMLPQNLFITKPNSYSANSKIEIAMQLNGENAGRAQVHLNDGKFDVTAHLSSDLAKKFNISLPGVGSNATTQQVEETT